MKKLFLILFLFLMMVGVVRPTRAIKEIGFTVTNSTRTYEVGRDQTYDYSSSVIEENGTKKVYVCGGGVPGDEYAGHDAIYLTEVLAIPFFDYNDLVSNYGK